MSNVVASLALRAVAEGEQPVAKIVVTLTDAAANVQTVEITSPAQTTASFSVSVPGTFGVLAGAFDGNGNAVGSPVSASGVIPTPPPALGVPVSVSVSVS